MKLKGNKKQKSTYHHVSISALLHDLNTGTEGLSQQEAEIRLSDYGANALPDAQKISLAKIIFRQAFNPLIFILIAAAAASMVIGEKKDAVFIFLVIFLNTALGAYQEYSAEKSAASLHQLLRIVARVKRNAKTTHIPAEELVPGDLIFMESGIKVPADVRLISANQLEIDESFLTGESLASKKTLGHLDEKTVVAERSNMAFAGSTVLKGRAQGIVVNTGIHTEVGKISKNVAQSESAKPPLVLRMERFIRQISIFIIVLSVLLAVALSWQGMDGSSIFFFVVALAVSAIPEGLPVALTVALSIATRRMAKRNVIVRKLNAVESLGSCTIIASDKTGTLTANQQTVQKIVFADSSALDISGVGYNGEGHIHFPDQDKIIFGQNKIVDVLTEISCLANEGELKKVANHWKSAGDSVDVALLAMAHKYGIQRHQFTEMNDLLGLIPYESENKFSAAIYRQNGEIFTATKGAVETILGFCDQAMHPDSALPIRKEDIAQIANELAKRGFRVLAFARGKNTDFEQKDNYTLKDVPPSTFYGLVGFIDPLRTEAVGAVQQCQKAGIKVLMITGDHPETAATIARELGIADDHTSVVTGAILTEAGGVDSDAFKELVHSSSVFARVSPTQKLEIVDVLIKSGEFVAVTGDGVNDAPALKRANIGVAMGSGTDVAKEVGAMIVIDDNFSSIVAGIEEGRYAYDNVRKVIYLLISTGGAEILLFLASIFMGLPMPLLAVQLLWLNLVTNGIQDVALAFEGGEPGAMQRLPRHTNERIFNGLMIKQTLVAATAMGGIAFAYWYYLNQYTDISETHARDLVLLLMVFMQNFHAFNCRSEHVSTFKTPLSRNYILVFGVLAAQGIHILSMHLPFMQNILRIEPITFSEWISVLLLAIPVLLVMEIFKFFNAKS